MNISIKTTMAVVAISAVSLVSGQSIDAKSREILDAVTAKYNGNQNNYFKFSFGSGPNGRIQRTEPGIYYSSGQMYRLKIMGTEQIYDGNKIYNISEDDSEVTVAKPNASQQMFSPINYLTNYRKEYNVKFKGTTTVNGQAVNHIQLTPVRDNGLQSVNLYINKDNNSLVQLEQYGKNRDISIISIQNHTANQKLRPDMFTFDKSKFKNYIITQL